MQSCSFRSLSWVRFFTIAAAISLLGAVALLQGCGGISKDGPPPPPPPPPPPAISVLTYHNDNSRSGLNANETALTPANVNVNSFGKIFADDIDGYTVAEPLYMAGVAIGGAAKNVVFVATEHDSVYAFDGDNPGPPLWQASFIKPSAGITTVPQSDVNSTIFPEIGITSTPVIDPTAGTIYVEAMTKENGNYFQRLHALDITTGKDRPGSPATISGSVGQLIFDPKMHLQRPGLLLANGKLYLAFGSHGDTIPYHGWLFAYDATTLQQAGIWVVTPDGTAGAIWMGGDGPATDDVGNVFVVTANGDFNANTGGRNYSDSIVKLAPDVSKVLDFFTPFDEQQLATIDEDVGGGGVLLTTDASGTHVAITTNKGGDIYVTNRDNLGHFHVGDNSQILQFLPGALGTGSEDRCFTSPAAWNGFVYFIGAFDNLRAYQLANGKLTATGQSGTTFGFQGSSPVVSANGNQNGIVWAIDHQTDAVLRAFDAGNVANELYNSDQNGARDSLASPVAHFIVPTVANGKVFVATRTKLVVYGLLK